MKRNINVSHLVQTPIEKQRVELVERKCIGHPDSLADGVAEAISRALCREYMEEAVERVRTLSKDDFISMMHDAAEWYKP